MPSPEAGPPKSAPTLRPATLEDTPAMVRVLQAAFPRWPAFDIGVSPLEHLRWKMAVGDDVDPERHAVAIIDGEVVGVRLRWITHVHVGSGEYLCDTGADVAVDPDWQGHGIGRLFATARDRQAAESEFVAIQTLSRSPQLLFMNDIPTHILHPISVWVRGFSPARLLTSHLRARAPTAIPRDMWRSFGPRRVPAAGPVRIDVLEAFDERTDALWEATRPTFDVARRRTADYLNWRYVDRAGGDALVLAATEGSDVIGYGVFKLSAGHGNVLDLVVHPKRRSVGRELLAAGSRRMRELGARQMTCWLPPGHLDEQALEANAFVRVDERTLDFRRREHAGPPAAVAVIEDRRARMHVMMGDFDFV